MDEEERYIAASWFIAGFLAAAPWYGKDSDHAISPLWSSLERHAEGRCLDCKRRSELLDGLFCPRCHPGTAEILKEYDECHDGGDE